MSPALQTEAKEIAAPPLPDLSACDREPIHVPGSIQPHGMLLVIDETATGIVRMSANCPELLGLPSERILGQPLTDVFGTSEGGELSTRLHATPEGEPLYLMNLDVGPGSDRKTFAAVAHRYAGSLILELEPAEAGVSTSFQNLYPLVRAFIARAKSAPSLDELTQLATDQIRRLTGFDRVLLYKFDNNWNGHVVAESSDGRYPTYLDLWFPASDIPEQARRLYTRNRMRSIVDANYQPVPIVPARRQGEGDALDLTLSALRSVSPVHVEYLKNMGVVASMSISIVTGDGKLWGLIACHHASPRYLPLEVRTACDFLAQTVSVQLQSDEERTEYRKRIGLSARLGQLLSFMAREDNFADGLVQNPDELLAYAGAGGAAILYQDNCTLLGETPDRAQVKQLVDWLIVHGRADLYATDRLAAEFAPAEAYREIASGLLAISISQLYRSYILWFRPEVVSTVKWGGDPNKPVEQAPGARIHPRRSFDAWRETVRGRSHPWSPAEVDAATQFRNAIVGVVLRKAEELADLSAELQRSNKELAAFSYSVSHDLRAPFRHIVGYAELLRKSQTAQLAERDVRYLSTIIESAEFAGTLVDNLLNFSQVGRAQLQLGAVDFAKLVREVQRDLELDCGGRQIEWRLGDLPTVEADFAMMRLVWQNLLQNAIKYTRKKDCAVIEIASSSNPREFTFTVRDNGVGFDQQYVDKLFGVFQRLHRMEEYEGTGIGLANVRRIVARHGGRTWAEGKPGEGASFHFTLPREHKRSL